MIEYTILTYPSLESTNTTAMELSPKHGTVILAHRQTNGRGQRGNKWNSQDQNQSLTFSLAIEPSHIAVDHQFQVSMIAAISACQAVRDFITLGDCKIKWPNDIWIDNQKVAGILIEHQLMCADSITRSIIGVGINVNQDEFDPSLPNPVSMKMKGSDVSTEQVLDAFLVHFSDNYQLSVEELKEQFTDLLWNNTPDGRLYKDLATGKSFCGIFQDINPNSGQISILNTTDNIVHKYWFKEIAVELPDGLSIK